MYRCRPALRTLCHRHTSLLPHYPLPHRSRLFLDRSRASTTSPHALRAYSTNPNPRKSACTSCGNPLPTPLPACPNCFHIESKFPDVSYYEILGLETDPKSNPFLIDSKELQQKFRQVQRFIHPDVWASRGEEKADKARFLSSVVNTAYQVLLNPVSRVQYILSQEGVEALEETDKLDDKEFIMEVMEAREEIEDATDEEQMTEIRDMNKLKIEAVLQEIEDAVHQKNWSLTREAAVRLKYLQSIEDAAKEWPNVSNMH